MEKHRVIVNTTSGSITPDKAEAVEVEPGRLYARQPDGGLRPLDAYGPHSVGEYVGSGWHDRPGDAFAEVAEELARRAQALANLRAACLAKSEVAVHV